jgi:hypothetical protein
VNLVRHRQTKEPETDRGHLKPPRHISTLPPLPSWQLRYKKCTEEAIPWSYTQSA